MPLLYMYHYEMLGLFRTVERLKAEVAKCEFKEQNKLDKSKVEYSRELKCNTALEAILKALDVSINTIIILWSYINIH